MRVLFIDTVHPVLEEMLTGAQMKCDHDYVSGYHEIRSKISNYDGLVVRSRIPIDAGLLAAARNLKFIARSGAGLENIDLKAAEEAGIRVFNSPEGNRDAVGEQAIGMLLSLFNHLKKADTEVRSGIWNREGNRGLELAGKTVGIIGYGQMGSALAKKLSGFECRILAYDKYKSGFGNEWVAEVSLDEILKESDIISLHLPQSEETHYYVNEAFIHKAGKPFFLINTGRGKHVETLALIRGLESGKVMGACLDVLEFEKKSFDFSDGDNLPEAFRKLTGFRNVVFTPHVAGWTEESYVKLSRFLGEKILKEF